MPVAEVRRAGDGDALLGGDHLSHSSARRTNRSVGIRCCSRPAYIIIRWKPIRPMSWVSGIQLSDTSCSLKPAAWRAPSALARMLPCVSTTPLGSLVEPEENWMNAVCPRCTPAGVPARRNVVELRRRGRCAASSAVHASGSPVVRGERRQPVAQLAGPCTGTAAQLLRDAQQLVLVFVADADGHRHRHDAAVQAGPVGVDELLVARDVQDQHVAGPGADALQVVQDAERALAQFREGAGSSRRLRPRGKRSRRCRGLRSSSISGRVWYLIIVFSTRM